MQKKINDVRDKVNAYMMQFNNENQTKRISLKCDFKGYIEVCLDYKDDEEE